MKRILIRDRSRIYTNSTQLPVNYSDDLFETLMLQDDLQSKYTAERSLHLFLGEMVDDVETVKGMVKKIIGEPQLPLFYPDTDVFSLSLPRV